MCEMIISRIPSKDRFSGQKNTNLNGKRTDGCIYEAFDPVQRWMNAAVKTGIASHLTRDERNDSMLDINLYEEKSTSAPSH